MFRNRSAGRVAAVWVVLLGLGAWTLETDARPRGDGRLLAFADEPAGKAAPDRADREGSPEREERVEREVRGDRQERGDRQGRGDRDERSRDQRRGVNDDDWFRGPSSGDDEERPRFPSYEVHDAVVANARAATARAVFRRADSALASALRQAQRTFENSAELKQATADEQRAYDAYNDARRQALRQVVSDPRYEGLVSLRQDLAQQIESRRDAAEDEGAGPVRFAAYPGGGRGPAGPRVDGEVLGMATIKLRVAADAREMENVALQGDDRVKQAQADLVAASARVSAVRGEFDQRLREDEDLKAARELLEDARIARVASAAYLRGASLAAEEALDFAYFLHRYDRTRSYDSYPYDGYPYNSLYSGGYGLRTGYLTHRR